ncbi:MAG: M14 family zinc carboxypeptidase [Thermoanaerobaculia bacterium]
MTRHTRRVHWILLTLLALLPLVAFGSDFMPLDHRTLSRSVTYAEMESFLASVDGEGPVRVSEAGKTTQGRKVYLVNLQRSESPEWTILFYAQQHGDEISGKDALLYLIRDIAAKPELLPADVDLWIMPMMNPDGAEAGTRVNGAGADLNRDHMTLDQPETRALHDVVQRIHPDIAVDCHEFGRESEGYRKRGWRKWPDITMDGLNNPLFDRDLVEAADRWFEGAAKAQAEAGHPFLRYWVGGTPPDEEQRHSAPDIDSAMNAIGTYGALSFIIEAAASKDPDAIARELGNRVDAYLVLLRRFVAGDGDRSDDVAALAAARARALPPFLPGNYLWVNPDATVTRFPVVEIDSGKIVEVLTPNMMTTVAVKRSVPTPLGYAIEPRAADLFATLLGRHAIPFETLAAPRKVNAEACTLVRVEDGFDELYARYEGRQIVTRGDAAERELPAGALWVPLTGPSAVRAALLLEPVSLYGLYQYPQYRALAEEKGTLPILRVVR